MVFTVNFAIVCMTLMVALLLKRGVAMYTTVFLLWLGMATANGVILLNRPSPFTFSDFLILPSVLAIITVYLEIFSIILIVIAILAALSGIVLLWIKCPKRKIEAATDIPVFLISVLLIVASYPLALVGGGITNEYGDLAQSYYKHGFSYSFARSVVFHGISEPDDYEKKYVQKLLAEIEEKRKAEASEESGVVPNVIYVQLESFFDVNAIKNVQFSENPLPNFTALKNSCPSGYLTVPMIGSGTANTEFEVLTGMNMDYFSPGEYPFIMALRENYCESVASLFKERGYGTFTMHNNTGTFYSRHEVYPNLGFDVFIPIEYMYGVEYNDLGWAKDTVLIKEIEDCLAKTQGRDFIFTVSVQPHGAYPTEKLGSDKIKVTGIDDPELENMYSYYVNEMYETDKMIGELVEKYSDFEEPTMIVFYGDHIADLKLTEQDLSIGDLYSTEYVIWTNYELENDAPAKDLQTFQLSSYVFELLGINDGIMNGIHRYYADSPDYEQIMRTFEYDALYGEKYSYANKESYATDMTYGNNVIDILYVEYTEDSITVYGKGFNEFSVIYVNGKAYETEYSESYGVLSAQINIKEGKEYAVSVGQTANDGYVFSYTPEFTVNPR